MSIGRGHYVSMIRQELIARSTSYATLNLLPHVTSYGELPVVVVSPRAARNAFRVKPDLLSDAELCFCALNAAGRGLPIVGWERLTGLVPVNSKTDKLTRNQQVGKEIQPLTGVP
jgi:hypothetical protein